MSRGTIRIGTCARLAAVVAVLLLLESAGAVAQSPSGWQTDVKTGKAEPRSKPVRRPPAVTGDAEQAGKPQPGVRARSASLLLHGDKTRFVLDLTGAVGVQVYALADPRQVVIDLAEVTFELPSNAGRQGKGLVAAYRFGLIEAGQARVVLDLSGPARIEVAEMQPHGAPGHTRLLLQLAAVDEATFVSQAAKPQPAPSPETETSPQEQGGVPRSDRERAQPVVVIDPGHGGVDPGAVGSTEITEKAVVLAVAKQVAHMLGAGRRYKVVLTRTSDVFVALDKRLETSRRHEADLFVSIHADAVTAKFAQAVRGATIYTLAEKASDERARLLAEKENAADSLAGIAPVPDSDRDQVAGILIDLMKRETANFSQEFSGLLASRLKGALSLAKDPQRGAAFKVLKQTQSPSVLIELGYMTNADDERQLMSPDWQRKVAQSIAAAIDAYFTKRVSSRP